MSEVDEKTLRAEIRRKGVTADRLRELAALSPVLAKAVAAGRHTPAAVLAELSTHPDAPVRRTVAANANTAAATLTALAGDPSATVLKAVAVHADTPVSVLIPFLLSRSDALLELVLERPHWPVELQRAGATAADVKRRWKTARRRDLTPEIVALLSADPDDLVQLHLIMFHGQHLPEEVVDAHAQSDSAGLRAVCAEFTRDRTVLHRLLGDPASYVLAGAVKNPLLSVTDLDELIRQAQTDQRYTGSVLFALSFAPQLSAAQRDAVRALETTRPFP